MQAHCGQLFWHHRVEFHRCEISLQGFCCWTRSSSTNCRLLHVCIHVTARQPHGLSRLCTALQSLTWLSPAVPWLRPAFQHKLLTGACLHTCDGWMPHCLSCLVVMSGPILAVQVQHCGRNLKRPNFACSSAICANCAGNR